MKLYELLTEKVSDKSYIEMLVNNIGYDVESAKDILKSIKSEIKSLPDKVKLYRIISVDSKKDINLLEPGSHYSRNKQDLITNYSFTTGYGDKFFLITAMSPKELIDVNRTIENNILYPNEVEVTLKNKGRGVDIISVIQLPR
jgi:hypothetical protein